MYIWFRTERIRFDHLRSSIDSSNVADAVKLCQDYFEFDLPSVMIEKRGEKFLNFLKLLKKP